VNSYRLCIVRREGEDDVMDGFMHDACDNFGSLFCGLAKLGGNNLNQRSTPSTLGQQHTTKISKKIKNKDPSPRPSLPISRRVGTTVK
jgi:hypothetical protein